jgi:hypothetical protein
VFRWRDAKPVYAAASSFRASRQAGSAWNAPGNFIWHCTPACPELRIRFAGTQTSRRITLALDANDRYRLLFYRNGIASGHADIPVAQAAEPGLRVVRAEVPIAVESYDAIGVLPLYGDGVYALGHLSAQ